MVTIDADRFEKTFRRYSQIGRTDDDGLHRLTLTETDRNVYGICLSRILNRWGLIFVLTRSGTSSVVDQELIRMQPLC